jgi:hypothetical protein
MSDLPPVVLIRWFDASYNSSERAESDIECRPIEMVEVGFLIKENKDAIVVGMEHAPDHGTFRHVVTIPRVNVRSLTRLDKGAKRGRLSKA